MMGKFDWRYLFRLGLGAIFLYAAVTKLPELGKFAESVHNYRMLPVSLENLFAMALIGVEIVVGVTLILNVLPKSSTILVTMLLVMFFIAILQAVLRGLDIDCGCFGTDDASKTGWVALLRDLGMLAMAFLGYPRK